MDRRWHDQPWASAVSASVTKLGQVWELIEWGGLPWKWLGLIGLGFLVAWILLLIVVGLSAGAAAALPLSAITPDTGAELAQAAQQGVQAGRAASPTSMPMTAAQQAALAALAIAAGVGIALEAMGAMGATVAITRGETVAVTQALGAMVAAGGLTAAMGLVGISVIAAGVVISLVALGITATVVVPAMARALTQSHPLTRASVGTGEQTDDMHQAMAQAANPMGLLTLSIALDAPGLPSSVTIGGRGLDLDDPTLDAGGPSSVAPSLSLDVSLSPVASPNPVASDLVDVPGAMPDPGDITAEPGLDGLGEVGLMLAWDPGLGPAGRVPTLPSLLLLGLGLGLWRAHRRGA